MMLAVVLAVSAAPPAWCDEARALLDDAPVSGAEAWPRYLAVAEKLPKSADAVVDDARRRAGEDGALGASFAALRLALDDGCRDAPKGDATGARAEVARLLAGDERFTGTREEPDLFDLWKQRFFEWLAALLESEAMRSYAGASRALYLSGLALFVAFVAFRLWRARARGRAAAADGALTAQIERERAAAYDEHRRDARARLDEGDLRGALRAGQLALLARIGEVSRGAVTPARTNREVLAHLDDERRAIVAPPLSLFERAFYGGHAERALVVQFLDDVDGAAARIAAGAS